MNLDQRLQIMLGQLMIQNMALQLENEQLKVQIAANSKPELEPTNGFMKPIDNGGGTAV